MTETNGQAIQKGIKTVGIGKKGSKALDKELSKAICDELINTPIAPVVKGAFLGALYIKGITSEERILAGAFTPDIFENPDTLVESIAAEAPVFVKECCVRLLQKETLDKETAQRLGGFLFSDKPGDGARGLVASILRVRYETPEEYAGLLLSLQNTIERPFLNAVPEGDPVVQIAEPLDGVDHSYLITPLLANFLQNLSFRAVSLVGRNSGPKAGNNLLDVAKAVDATFLSGSEQLGRAKPKHGWYLNQEDMSKPIDRWVDLRRQIIKRPFLATLERFINPVSADLLIASAFHPPYGEKMLNVAEGAGYPGIIIVRNGLEGTIAFALKRAVRVLCSAKQSNNVYVHHEIVIDPGRDLQIHVPFDEKLEYPSLEENARLINEHSHLGKTSNKLFDLRVHATCTGIERAVNWIKEQSTIKQ